MNFSELEKKISAANRAYANGMPFMTDTEYDKLWKQLHNLDPYNKFLYHTARNPNLSSGIRTHPRPIYGTNKAFNMDDLKPFMTRFGTESIIIEPKYDGCAGALSYDKEGLTLILEGDGLQGHDVTRHLPNFHYSFEPKTFETVEIIIPWIAWDESLGKNPRNVVSGWLNRKHFPDHHVEMISHNYGKLSHYYNFDGDYDTLSALLLRLYKDWSQLYPIDGLMLKVADETRRLVASNNGTTNNWSIAWKPPIQIKSTTVIDIEWNVSRLGKVVPTIIYEPIELCGTTNKRVTANNAAWVTQMNIQIGAEITIGKAGEIIPKIIEVKKPNKIISLTLPSLCPKCGQKLIWEGVHLVCQGSQCLPKLIGKLNHFYSKERMYLWGLGQSNLEKLLSDPQCYVVLAEKPWALLDPFTYNIYDRLKPVLGEATSKTILKSAQSLSGQRNAAHFIAGLSLENLGYKTAIRLINYVRYGELKKQISHKAQQYFIIGLDTFYQAQKEMKYFEFADVPAPAKILYCISGTLTTPRNDMIAMLEKFGWEYSSSVTKRIDFLILGENPGRNKKSTAERYGKEILTEEEILKRIKK